MSTPVGVLEAKVHTNVTGLLFIAALANKLNKSLSDKLLTELLELGELPDVMMEIPILNKNPDLNPWWVSGFIAGDGCFTYNTMSRVNKKKEIMKYYSLSMEVSQKTCENFILKLTPVILVLVI